jgi:hypothetical protein
MFEILDFIALPGLAGGLLGGGGGAYILGVRDPFLIALAAVVLGLLGLLVVDLGIPWRRQPWREQPRTKKRR